MKKIFYLASIAALAFSSCAKDETTQAAIEDAKGGSKIVAAMEADDTRTHLETTNGKDFEYRWSLGDQLGIYGYGENTLSNAAFVLDNASDNSPVGVFTSQHKLDPKSSYMAVYPRFAEPLFHVASSMYVDDPSTTNVNEAAYEMISKTNGASVTMKILPEQKYQNETFYTTTAPAISGTFEVSENGEAAIGMQPVADYLMVNLTSTEEIKTLTLRLQDGSAPGTWLKIAGESNLASYWMNGKNGMEYRYYIPEGGAEVAKNFANKLNETAITIKTDESYKTVACHEPNTYVFTIPAGLLGMGNNIEAFIWVNDVVETDVHKADFAALTREGAYNSLKASGVQLTSNFQLNSASAKVDQKNAYDRIDETKDAGYKQIASKLENTVFWVNEAIDTNNDKIRDYRTSFEYNPNGDKIIHHEAQLLEYIVEYSKGNPDFYGHDAFLCSGATFDFSEANMVALATELKNKVGENNVRYETYIANYLTDFSKKDVAKYIGGFPCFPAEGQYMFKNAFIGNGAEIINIFQPLLSEYGIFGGAKVGHDNVHYTPYVTRAHGNENVSTADKKASINDVTFANITSWYDAELVLDMNLDKWVETSYGYILASNFNGKISNVTVSNANGGAVMGNATVAQLKGLTLTDNDQLCNIFERLTLDGGVDLSKVWAELSAVEDEVFQVIIPADNAATTADKDLNVINIDAADATYAKLTNEVYIGNDHAAAVVINDVSYWTGDSFATSKVINAGTNKGKGYYVQYAEQLAAMNADNLYELTRDMDLNYANLQWYASNGALVKHYPWTMVEAKTIDGAGNSVSQVNMFAYDTTSKKSISEIAPFKGANIQNIILNDVVIDINTQKEDSGLVVPIAVAGVSVNATNVNNVTVNNVAINAYRADGTNNTQANYAQDNASRIGWVVALSKNTRANNVKVTGAHSSARGIAGVFGQINIGTEFTDSAQLTDVTVSGVSSTTVNVPITDFVQFKMANAASYNVLGTVVGCVTNDKTATAADIKFINSKPVFMYYAPNAALNVLYNGDKEASLKNK